MEKGSVIFVWVLRVEEDQISKRSFWGDVTVLWLDFDDGSRINTY